MKEIQKERSKGRQKEIMTERYKKRKKHSKKQRKIETEGYFGEGDGGWVVVWTFIT